MPSNHLILCHPLLLLSSVFPNIRAFSNKSAVHIRCPKYWSFSFRISPSNGYSGLISFRIDWFDLLAVQETLKSLFQHHNLKALTLQHSTFFMVHLSHLVYPRRRKWQPIPVFLLGKPHGWRSLVGYSPWGHKELDVTEHLHFHFQSSLWLISHIHTWLLEKPNKLTV